MLICCTGPSIEDRLGILFGWIGVIATVLVQSTDFDVHSNRATMVTVIGDGDGGAVRLTGASLPNQNPLTLIKTPLLPEVLP